VQRGYNETSQGSFHFALSVAKFNLTAPSKANRGILFERQHRWVRYKGTA